jgi:hypothetical protein
MSIREAGGSAGATGFGAVLVESCARRLKEPSPTALATSKVRPSELKGRECMRLSSATTGKSYKTWKSFNKAIEPKGTWLESQSNSCHANTRPLDAKHPHPVIYSIFLISTSLNSQHLNGGIARRVSSWLPFPPTNLSTHKKKRTAQQSYYNCTIIGSLMLVLRFPVRALFFLAAG